MHKNSGRLRYLDGFRGLAILLVVFYHYCGPVYSGLVRYNAGVLSPIVAHGWVGVQLFFMISGFVILMTLEKCSAFGTFLYRRWLRLFPVMLIATAVVFLFNATTDLPGPHVTHQWFNIIPGLTFITPSILHAVSHVDFKSMDAVFWTLYTEAGFYVVFGICYFKFDWRVATAVLVVLALVTTFGRPVLTMLGVPPLLTRGIEPLEWLNMQLYSWLASGAMFWKARENDDLRLFAKAVLLAIGTALIQVNTIPLQWSDRAALILVALAFTAAQVSPALQVMLDSPIPAFFGYISYPLYLLHNEIGVSIITYGNAASSPLSPIVVVGGTFLAATVFAWLVTVYGEGPVRRGITTAIARLSLVPLTGRPVETR
ncbi:acyltransferase [Sphingomonas sp. TREG-RG-20F-R18-01]|uniref:acyltransferase family protein n=1 Tax=Sphingomonas sp. TREG-RG-20F-R18-01 TaxID=2914982 RepID=UPI001F56D4CD|nr:acyltransferase [Sphingomonas sp. TREG-RG-20F-R18-01]